MRINRIALITEMARQDVKVKELAEKAGVSRATVTAMRGGKSCAKSSVNHVCRALGIDPAELIRKEE